MTTDSHRAMMDAHAAMRDRAYALTAGVVADRETRAANVAPIVSPDTTHVVETPDAGE